MVVKDGLRPTESLISWHPLPLDRGDAAIDKDKALILEVTRRRAERQARQLAGEILGAAAEEKEALRAGLEFEIWLAESCQACIGPDGRC